MRPAALSRKARLSGTSNQRCTENRSASAASSAGMKGQSCSSSIDITRIPCSMAPRVARFARSQRGEYAAIDIDDLAVDEIRCRGGEEDGCALQFLDPAPAAGRRAVPEPGVKIRIVDQGLVQRGHKIAR